MSTVRFLIVSFAIAALVACHVQHDGSFEHDAGFVAASASIAVQIGKPPPTPIATADAGGRSLPNPPRIGPTASF